MKENRKKTRLSKCIMASLLVTLFMTALSGCFLFEEVYKPGEQIFDGKWYAEHDYGLGNRTIKGVIDDSLITWEEKYSNEVQYSLVRHYADGTTVDLMAAGRDENDFLRMACHEDDNTFVISGIPSWASTEDSYVKGEIFNYGENVAGLPEDIYFSKTFSSEALSEALLIDIGTYQLKPINPDYTLTFDLKYMYKGSGAVYVEKTYSEITALGFALTADDDTSWVNATGYDEGDYARVLEKITAADIEAGSILIENAIGGGKYSAGGSIFVGGNLKSFPASGPSYMITIDGNNPNAVIEAEIYID